MVKSDRNAPPPVTATLLSTRTATAPVSSSVKSAQAAGATTTPYGPVSRASTNADAFSASASGGATSGGGRVINCRVTFLDDTHAIFRVPIKAKGGVLLKQVFKHLRVLEPEYFGLQYRDAGEVHYWVDSEKPLNRHPGLTIPSSDVPANFVFCVKFYSSDPAYLEDEFTRYLFVLQIRRDLALGHLVCQDHTAALLAAYVVQAEEGDFNRDNYRDYTYLLKYRFSPRQDVNFLRMVMENHVELQGQNPAEADLNYLEIARRCEMYGIRLHDATDHEGVALQLAVSHLGVNVFQSFQKVNLFSWAKIRKLSFKRRKFLIKLHPETYQGYYKDTVEFLFDSRNACKSFWKQCIEHHVFFRGRTNEQNISRSRSSRMFQYGSHFRFTGRTQRQVVECMKETLTKRSASASATPSRAHNMSSAATRQASVGGASGGHTLPSSKSYTATLTATPLLPIAQMRRPNQMPNRFNTTGGSRIDRHHKNGNGNVNGGGGADKPSAASNAAVPTVVETKPLDAELAQSQPPPDIKPTTQSTSTFSPIKQQAQVDGTPPVQLATTATLSTISNERSQTLPRAAPVRAAGLGENEQAAQQQPVQTTAQIDQVIVETSTVEEDADKTPTQTRKSFAAAPQHKQAPGSVSGSHTSSTTSTLSRKSPKTEHQLPPPLSTAINGNDGSPDNNEDQQQLLPPVDDSDEQQQQQTVYATHGNDEAFSPSTTASDNATPTTASTGNNRPKATVMRESEFIEEYVMPVPPPPIFDADEQQQHEHGQPEEEEDSLTGMNMTEEVPYVLYRRKIKWDKFLTYPPPPQSQQGQILLSPEELEQQQQNQMHHHHHHHRSAQQLAQQALLQHDTAQPSSPYTTYTRYLNNEHEQLAAADDEDQTRIHYADHPPSSGAEGATVITDVHIEQQRLLPVGMPVLLTSGQHKSTPQQQQRTPTPVQQAAVVKSLHSSRQQQADDNNEALIAAMPSTKLRVLDYVAVVNRNRLPPVSMCYSYEDDSVSIDSLQRQLFESVKRKQAARIRDGQQQQQQTVPQQQQPQPNVTKITPLPATHEARRPSKEQTKDQQQTRRRSHSIDSIASTASSASHTSSSASEASYNTTSVDDNDFDDENETARRRSSAPRSSRPAKKSSSKSSKASQPPLYVATKHKQHQNQLGVLDAENLAYADESATTVTDTNNNLLNTSATTPQGSNSGSDDQYYKAIRQRTLQQAAAAGPVGTVPYYYGIDPDDLVVPPPPPPSSSVLLLAEKNKNEYLYNYEEDPARAYLLAQQRRSRSLNAPRTSEASPPPPPTASQHQISPAEDAVAAALLASQQQRRPSYDLAVTAGRMLANGGHGVTASGTSTQISAPSDGVSAPFSGSKVRTRVAGSRASAIGAVVPETQKTVGSAQQQQQPLKAMSTTLDVYPSYEDAVTTANHNDDGRRPIHEKHQQAARLPPNGVGDGVPNNNYRQQYYDAILLPPKPPGAGTHSSTSTSHTGGNNAHNDFSESELNAFVEMSYQDLQATVREYSLSSDRFTSSEGISTASSPSGANSPTATHRRADDFIYPASFSRQYQHSSARPHQHQQRTTHNQQHHPGHFHRQHHSSQHRPPPPQQPVQIVTTTTTTTTDETSTSPHRSSRVTGGGRPQQSSGKPPARNICHEQRTNAGETTTTSHTEASTTATGSEANGSSCSSSSYTSSSPSGSSSTSASSTTSSARRRTAAEDVSSPAGQQLLDSAAPNLKLDTVLIPPTPVAQTQQPPDPSSSPVESAFMRHRDSKKTSKLATRSAVTPPMRQRPEEEHSFSPPPPPLPELHNIPPNTVQSGNAAGMEGPAAAPTSYMDEWRAKMRELEQLTGVTSPTSSSSSSTGTGMDQSPLDGHSRGERYVGRQQPMPIIPPPAEFGNNSNVLLVGDEEGERRSLSEVHGASGVSYGATGGRLFELTTPRNSVTPLTPLQPPTVQRQQAAASTFRTGQGGSIKMDSDDLTHASRL